MIDVEKVKEESKLPKHLDMELELLGMCLLKNGKCIPAISAILKPEDFYLNEHQHIFSAILDLYDNGTPPNMPTIADWLRRKGLIFKGESGEYVSAYDKVYVDTIMNLGIAAFTDDYAENYAHKIKEASRRRKLVRLSNQIKNNAVDLQQNFQELLTSAEKSFRDISGIADEMEEFKQQFYFDKFFEKDIRITSLYAKRTTGFYNIDAHQIFTPGLYVIGATPAAGKTTFCWQLLSQLAKNGEICIFCSYEMSAFELYSKSLARELFIRDRHSSLSAADIRSGAHSVHYDETLASLLADENGVYLVELRNKNIDDLLRFLKPRCIDNKKSPVVCLDYLQIIPSTLDSFSDKTRLDNIVHKLKTFQRETNTTFIVVSSFNRVNYFQQVSFESFKESGNIEYTADVVWALQLNVANQIKTGALISDTRKKFDTAKKQQPRHIQLKCLKNRQGQNYDCYFNYYSAHDYFEPCEEKDFQEEPTDKMELNIPNPTSG